MTLRDGKHQALIIPVLPSAMLNLGGTSTHQQLTNNTTNLWQEYVHIKVVKAWDHWDSSLILIFTSSSLSTDVLRWGCSWKGFEIRRPAEERKHLPKKLGGILDLAIYDIYAFEP